MPAGLGSGVRFHPATLSDALVNHDADDVGRLLGIVELDLLGGLDNRRWWLTVEVVRVVPEAPKLCVLFNKDIDIKQFPVQQQRFIQMRGGMSKRWLG